MFPPPFTGVPFEDSADLPSEEELARWPGAIHVSGMWPGMSLLSWNTGSCWLRLYLCSIVILSGVKK